MLHPPFEETKRLLSRAPITVLALGGNAILQRGQRGTFQEQYENVRSTMAQIAALLNDGFRVVIVHGNGPQIGATVIRHELGHAKVPPLPLHACGGGGIPVIRQGTRLQGVEAVIDKDLAAERLATSIHAESLVILTDVEGVYLDYGKPNQRLLSKISPSELETYAQKGYFAKGSMGPKVEAAIRFLRNGGKRAVIANLGDLGKAINGTAGTQIRN